MKSFRHSFAVKAPIDDVIAFHRHSQNMGAITPPPIIPRIHRAPEFLDEGQEMNFTLWMGPIPIHWVARYENVTANSFIDRQVEGPFRQWVHEHRFESVDEQSTIVHDSINLEFKSDLRNRLVGVGMWVGLPLLFAYRQRQTRKLLEKS